jgi:hypothetical protein
MTFVRANANLALADCMGKNRSQNCRFPISDSPQKRLMEKTDFLKETEKASTKAG